MLSRKALFGGLGLLLVGVVGGCSHDDGVSSSGGPGDAAPGFDGGASDGAIPDGSSVLDAGDPEDPAALDPSFGEGGAMRFAVSSSGSSMVVCLSTSALGSEIGATIYPEGVGPRGTAARVTSAGVLDSTFNPVDGGQSGVRQTDVQFLACAAQPDGKLVVARITDTISNQLLRLGTAGETDTTLTPQPLPFRPSVLAVAGSGDIIVGHDGAGGIEIATAQSSGALVGGAVVLPSTGDLAVVTAKRTPLGKVLLAGRTSNGVFVARLDGAALDPTFGTAGVTRVDTGQNSAVVALSTASDGTIVVVTGPGIRAARLDANGALDATFGSAGTVVHALDVLPSDVLVDGNRRIKVTVLRPTKAIALVSLQSSGALSTSFAADGAFDIPALGIPLPVNAFVPRQALIAIQADGNLVIAASRTETNPTFAFARVIP